MGKETHQGRTQDKAPPAPIERQRRRVADQGNDRDGGSGAGGVQKGEAHSRDRAQDTDGRKDDDSSRRRKH